MVDLNPAFRSVMSPRNLEDIRTKVKMIKRLSQQQMEQLFLDMCDAGIEQYIKSEKKRFPSKSESKIMRELYLRQNRT